MITRVDQLYGSFTGTSGNNSLTGVPAGALVVVLITKTDTGVETISVSDDVDGAYTQLVTNDANSGRQSQINYLDGHSGGDITITISSGAGSMVINYCFLVYTGAAAPIDSSFYDQPSNTKTPQQADATGVDALTGELILAVQTLNATGGTLTPDTGYTNLSSGTQHLHQELITGSDLTGEIPQISCTTARQGPGVCGVSPESVAAPAGPVNRSLINSRSLISGRSLVQ